MNIDSKVVVKINAQVIGTGYLDLIYDSGRPVAKFVLSRNTPSGTVEFMVSEEELLALPTTILELVAAIQDETARWQRNPSP